MRKPGSAAPGMRCNRDFQLLLGGHAVSFAGSQVQNFALPIAILAITGSAAQAGLVIGLNGIAFLVFGLLAGALADRWDREAIAIWCEVGRGALTLGVVLSRLERWLREVELGFADRILPITLPVAAVWGRQQHARPLPVIDGLIAATAKVNGLTVVTRNARDFERTGVQVLNPFGD
jgi:predicted nucleic acid-binding protein